MSKAYQIQNQAKLMYSVRSEEERLGAVIEKRHGRALGLLLLFYSLTSMGLHTCAICDHSLTCMYVILKFKGFYKREASPFSLYLDLQILCQFLGVVGIPDLDAQDWKE